MLIIHVVQKVKYFSSNLCWGIILAGYGGFMIFWLWLLAFVLNSGKIKLTWINRFSVRHLAGMTSLYAVMYSEMKCCVFHVGFIVLFPRGGKSAIVKYVSCHPLDSNTGTALQGLKA